MSFLSKISGVFHREEKDAYCAIVEKSGEFYSGEFPDMTWGKVTLCSTYEEALSRLTDKLNEQMKIVEHMPPSTPYEEMVTRYPGKQVIVITPKGPVHGKHGSSSHKGHDDSFEYYAWTEKTGQSFTGEMPDIANSRVTLCNTLDEVIKRLTERLQAEYEKAGKRIEKMPHKTSYSQMLSNTAGKQIVTIRPSRF